MSAKMFPCTFHLPCRVYTCRKMAKFYIGHPNTLANCEAYCEDCARSIVSSAPADFIPGAEQLLQQGREEAMVLFQEQQAEMMAMYQKQSETIQELTLQLLKQQQDVAFTPSDNEFESTNVLYAEEDPFTDIPDDEDNKDENESQDDHIVEINEMVTSDENDVTYACLDCPDLEPFKSKSSLTRHRNKHHGG